MSWRLNRKDLNKQLRLELRPITNLPQSQEYISKTIHKKQIATLLNNRKNFPLKQILPNHKMGMHPNMTGMNWHLSGQFPLTYKAVFYLSLYQSNHIQNNKQSFSL